MNPSPVKKIRVLFYAVNGLGLGHLTRLLAICKAMVAAHIGDPNLEIEPFFITTSDASNILSQAGIGYVHLPSKNLARKGGLFSYRRLARMYNAIVNQVYDAVQPHIMVVDTLPLGSMRDLENCLRFGNSFNVFIHREAKPEALEPYIIQSQRFYDLVIAPHYKDTAHIPLPEGEPIPLFWSGPILHLPQQQYTRAEARSILGVPDDKQLVLLTLGGGGDETNDELVLQALQVLQAYPQVVVVFAKGPLSTMTLQQKNVITTTVYPVSQLFTGLDAAVSAAGYNSFHELLYYGVPTIFVPRPRGLDDQHARAAKAAEQNACLICTEGDNFELRLKTVFDNLLLNKAKYAQNARRYVPVSHADTAAQEIINAYMAFVAAHQAQPT